jgi:hypothetical protein
VTTPFCAAGSAVEVVVAVVLDALGYGMGTGPPKVGILHTDTAIGVKAWPDLAASTSDWRPVAEIVAIDISSVEAVSIRPVPV